MEKVLTIIIPTYNMEQYLEKCLNSLITSKSTSMLEVIIINDGSKDNSLFIAQKYEKEHPNLFRVINKPNGNYGSCINVGLSKANGKYIKILDADDSFETKHLDLFLDFLYTNEVDLVLSDFAVTDSLGNIRKIIHYGFESGLIYDINVICDTINFRDNIQMHAVTYKKECLLKINYKQTEGISYTDQQWIFTPMISVKTVTYFQYYVYKYLIGREGQTINPSVKLKNISHTQLCALGMIEAYEQHKNIFYGQKIKKYLDARMFSYVKSAYINCFQHYSSEISELLIKYDEQIKLLSPQIYELIGSKEISSVLGFCYINYWRKHQQTPIWIISLVSSFYLATLKIKAYISKDSNDMVIPSSL